MKVSDWRIMMRDMKQTFHSLYTEQKHLKLQEWHIEQIKIGMIEADANQLVEHQTIVKFWQQEKAAFKSISANFV